MDQSQLMATCIARLRFQIIKFVLKSKVITYLQSFLENNNVKEEVLHLNDQALQDIQNPYFRSVCKDVGPAQRLDQRR